MENRYNKKNKKGAFVILIAVVVSSLLLSLGAFIANIAVKEIALSTSGRQSQAAFYAADAALECALYQDLRVQAFAATSSAAGPSVVGCNGTTYPILVLGPGPSATSSYTLFNLHFIKDGDTLDRSPYAQVRVTKENIGTINDATTIEALGYNVYDQTATKRVERALRVTY